MNCGLVEGALEGLAGNATCSNSTCTFPIPLHIPGFTTNASLAQLQSHLPLLHLRWSVLKTPMDSLPGLMGSLAALGAEVGGVRGNWTGTVAADAADLLALLAAVADVQANITSSSCSFGGLEGTRLGLRAVNEEYQEVQSGLASAQSQLSSLRSVVDCIRGAAPNCTTTPVPNIS